MTARVRLSDYLESLTRTEIKKAIYEANLGRENELIATRYLIERVPQIDIAIEIGCERSTISRRLKEIIPRVEWAAGIVCER